MMRNITSTTTSLFPMKRGMVEACTGVGFFNPIADTASRIHADNGGSSVPHARSFDRVVDPTVALFGAIVAPCTVHFYLVACPSTASLSFPLQSSISEMPINYLRATHLILLYRHVIKLNSALNLQAVDRETRNFQRRPTVRQTVRVQCSRNAASTYKEMLR